MKFAPFCNLFSSSDIIFELAHVKKKNNSSTALTVSRFVSGIYGIKLIFNILLLYFHL